MQEHTTIPFPHPQLTAEDPLTEVLRQGARQLLAPAHGCSSAISLVSHSNPRSRGTGK